MPRHVVSTTESHVWIVEADDPDAAKAAVVDQYEHEPSAIFWEGELDEYLTDIDRDGIALLNQ